MVASRCAALEKNLENGSFSLSNSLLLLLLQIPMQILYCSSILFLTKGKAIHKISVFTETLSKTLFIRISAGFVRERRFAVLKIDMFLLLLLFLN